MSFFKNLMGNLGGHHGQTSHGGGHGGQSNVTHQGRSNPQSYNAGNYSNQTNSQPSWIPCKKCNQVNEVTAKFCQNCGVSMNNNCRFCGIDNTVGSKFCGNCGKNLE